MNIEPEESKEFDCSRLLSIPIFGAVLWFAGLFSTFYEGPPHTISGWVAMVGGTALVGSLLVFLFVLGLLVAVEGF